jgi:hypothetical protein
MAGKQKADNGVALTSPAAVIEQHLGGDIMWLGFRRHGDGKFTRYQAITRDGKFVAVDSERNEGLASFARDFRMMVGKALQFSLNPLKRR